MEHDLHKQQDKKWSHDGEVRTKVQLKLSYFLCYRLKFLTQLPTPSSSICHPIILISFLEFWLFPLHPLSPPLKSQQRKYQHFRVVIIVITSSVSFKSDLYLVFMCVCKKSAFVLPGHFQLQFDGSQLCDVHQHHLRPCHKEVCACTRYHANQQPAQTLCFRHLKQRMPLVKDTHRKFFFLYTNSKTNTEWKEITAQRNTGHCNSKIPKRTKKMKYSNFWNKNMQ